MIEGELKKQIEREFRIVYEIQNTALRCGNSSEVKGLLIIHLQPNIEKIIGEAKKELEEKLKTIKNNSALLTADSAQEDTLKALILAKIILDIYSNWKKKWFGE